MNINHENVIRKLKDEPSIVDSLWCRFGIHRWTIWSDPEWRKDKWAIKCLFQSNKCVHCGTVKIRKINGIID
jgi:hypothetical protein